MCQTEGGRSLSLEVESIEKAASVPASVHESLMVHLMGISVHANKTGRGWDNVSRMQSDP